MVESINIPNKHKAIAVHALFENTFISENQIEIAEQHPIFQEAYKILLSLKVGKSFPKQLYELNKKRLPIAKRQLTKIAAELIQKFSKQISREKATEIWKKDKKKFYFDNFEELLKILQADNSKDRYIVRSLGSITHSYLLFSQKNFHPFEFEKVYSEATVEGSKYKRHSYLAYKVFDPLWDKRLHRFEPSYVNFPLKWAGSFLPTSFTEHLYSLYKNGKDVLSVFVDYYKNAERILRLEDAIENCPITKAFGEIFVEAVEAYRKKRYKIASVSFLSIIEGLIWEFAWDWNRFNGKLINPNVSRTKFRDNTTFQLLKPDGTRIGGRPNIGNLLRKTTFGEELYVEMIEFLCEELFDERNLVLHGRNPDYGDLNKVASLLFVIETIERAITEHTKVQIGKIVKTDIIPKMKKKK